MSRTDAELREAATNIITAVMESEPYPEEIDAAVPILRALVEKEREACAVVAAQMYPTGSAHTYASENGCCYRRQEAAGVRIAAAIRARAGR